MSTWTLFVILWLSDGGISVVESMQFNSEGACHQAVLYVENTPVEGVRKVSGACKERTDV